jgi:hypothetical protein
MAVFWVVAPCSLVEVYLRFRDTCCLHHQGHEYLLHSPDDASSISETSVDFYQITHYAMI